MRDLQRMSPRVLAGVLPRLYPQMLERAYAHQDAGRPVYIVTAASQEMADLLAHVLVFDGGVGSRLEVRDGRYTGRADGPFNYREGKVLSLRELAARDGIDLAASFAYSDSESDLPMLRAVGHPVVVNPDPDLSRIAAAEGWEVLRLDRLGRRLKIAVALSAGASLAGLGGVVRGRAGIANGGVQASASRRGHNPPHTCLDRGQVSRPSCAPGCHPRSHPTHDPTMSSTPTHGKIRVVVAKPGLDGHDRGAKIIARALRDAGMEVIYTGLHQTPEQIVETVIQEDADAVGLSILSGAHMTLVPRVVALLREQGVDDVLVTVGGTIPAEDIPELKRLGVAEVFTPGAPTQAIVDFIRARVTDD